MMLWPTNKNPWNLKGPSNLTARVSGTGAHPNTQLIRCCEAGSYLCPSRCQSSDELGVGWWKLQRSQIRSRDPPQTLSDQRPRRTGQRASIEVKLDGAVRVDV